MLNRERIFAEIQACVELSANDTERFAVLAVRVLGLREINLRFGYERGTQAEEDALMLIRHTLRPVDSVCRSGDDSFVIVLPGMCNRNHALLAASRLTHVFDQPLNRGSSPWLGRVVMGIAIYPEHGLNADLLCRHAERALDLAQQRGEHLAVYEPHIAEVEILHEELRDAIEANRLQTCFQPIRNLRTGSMVGIESLARWTNPRQIEISPSEFVPFAEQSNLIDALTRWSINATLRHAAALRETHGLTIAINFSPRAFNRPGVVEQLMDALAIWGMPPTAIVAEITETALVEDLESSVKSLSRLRDLGVRIAIDDFGTGYASISYLRQFPATELKIDQSLIGIMRNDPRTARLILAIIDMAHHLGMAAVAEGIEDQPTQDLLADMGCDAGQGYHLGRPEPAADFVARFTAP